jgi:hypothetical protein
MTRTVATGVPAEDDEVLQFSNAMMASEVKRIVDDMLLGRTDVKDGSYNEKASEAGSVINSSADQESQQEMASYTEFVYSGTDVMSGVDSNIFSVWSDEEESQTSDNIGILRRAGFTTQTHPKGPCE